MNGFPLVDLLRPLEATARRCRLPWAPPLLVYRANRLDAAGRAEAAASYVARLQHWRETVPSAAHAGHVEVT